MDICDFSFVQNSIRELDQTQDVELDDTLSACQNFCILFEQLVVIGCISKLATTCKKTVIKLKICTRFFFYVRVAT